MVDKTIKILYNYQQTVGNVAAKCGDGSMEGLQKGLNSVMMKKAIALLAALSMTITSAGAQLYAFAEAGEIAVQAAEEAQTQETEENEPLLPDDIEEFAKETCDPQYGRFIESQKYEIAENALENSIVRNATSDTIKYTGSTISHNSRFDNYDKIYGIDVSMFQYNIDWNKVKADGIDYAIIRLGYRGYGRAGSLVLDPYFHQNIKGATAAGVKVGIYFYTQAINTDEAKAEADFVLSYLRSYNIQLPVYYDIESVDYDVGRLDSAGLTKKQKTELCTAFCDRIIAAGYKAGVYANKYWLTNMIDGPALGEKYPIWIAQYNSYTDYTGKYNTWQFASTGKVNGISTNVDMNVDYRERGALTPTSISATVSDGKATITWIDPGNADKFEVYKVDTSKNTYSKVADTTANSYTVAVSDEIVPYCIRSVKTMLDGKISNSEYSDIIYVSNKIITGFTASSSDKRVRLTWDELPEADGYVIYRSEKGGSYQIIDEVTGTNTCLDTNVNVGIKYSYKIAPYFGDSETRSIGAETIPVSVVLKPAQVASLVQENASKPETEIKLSFGQVTAATGYEIAFYNDSAKRYDTVATLSANEASCTIDALKNASCYKTAVRAYTEIDGIKSAGAWSDIVKMYTAANAPAVTKATVTPLSVTVTWNAASGATKYIVYRKSGSSYIRIGSSKNTTYKFTDLTQGKRTYFVTSVYTPEDGKSIESRYSSAWTIDGTQPSAPKITSAAASSNAITFKWSDVPNVTGYRVYKLDAITRTYKPFKTINAKHNSCKLTGITERTSSYKIKAFRRDSAGTGTVWSKASDIKTMTLK